MMPMALVCELAQGKAALQTEELNDWIQPTSFSKAEFTLKQFCYTALASSTA